MNVLRSREPETALLALVCFFLSLLCASCSAPAAGPWLSPSASSSASQGNRACAVSYESAVRSQLYQRCYHFSPVPSTLRLAPMLNLTPCGRQHDAWKASKGSCCPYLSSTARPLPSSYRHVSRSAVRCRRTRPLSSQRSRARAAFATKRKQSLGELRSKRKRSLDSPGCGAIRVPNYTTEDTFLFDCDWRPLKARRAAGTINRLRGFAYMHKLKPPPRPTWLPHVGQPWNPPRRKPSGP